MKPDQQHNKPKGGSNDSDSCNRPAYHKMHMCVLRHMGQMQILDELSAKPAFRCCRCGAEASSDKNLCQPRPL